MVGADYENSNMLPKSMCWMTGSLSMTSAKYILSIPLLMRSHEGLPLQRAWDKFRV